jgi:enoyl-CoA hydratase
MNEFGCARVTVVDHVAEVALAATGKGQRMGPAYWDELPRIFEQLDGDAAVRAVLVHTAGDNFSYGLDLAAMAPALMDLTAPDARALVRTRLLGMIKRMQRTHDAVAACRKPVIAAIHGWCIGGGVDLITACDIRLAAADARLSVREVKMAIVPDVGTLARLPAIVGQGAARELALTGDDIDAARALRLGLVSEVYPTHETLLVAARAMAGRIARNPPLTVQGVKQVMSFTSEREARLSLDAVALWNAAFFPSEDLQEAIAAFLEKREPTFAGK